MPADTLLHKIWAATAAWRTLLCVLLLLVSWLAITPIPPRGASLGWDKLNHAAAFAALAFCASRARLGTWRSVAAGLLAYGVLIEVVQRFVPGRSGEAVDMLADAVGIAAGLMLAAACARALPAGR